MCALYLVLHTYLHVQPAVGHATQGPPSPLNDVSNYRYSLRAMHILDK